MWSLWGFIFIIHCPADPLVPYIPAKSNVLIQILPLITVPLSMITEVIESTDRCYKSTVMTELMCGHRKKNWYLRWYYIMTKTSWSAYNLLPLFIWDKFIRFVNIRSMYAFQYNESETEEVKALYFPCTRRGEHSELDYVIKNIIQTC